MTNKFKWQFPPRNGGIDYVQNPSSAHFSDNPIPKLAREIIQNSLDARESGIHDPITVNFSDISLKRELIGASRLYKHIKSCFDRAEAEARPDPIIDFYRNALEALKNTHVRCLRITDKNTTGLSGENWDALVSQEGSVQKSATGAPGGSFGIGKNAVFNVSDIQTVFYSTQYFDKREGGRVDKLQGKTTLMSHPDPDDKATDLQHIGFYTHENNAAISGRRRIPEPFRLDEIGTGVFIMGFNPRSSDWVSDVTAAVIENFFYALHHKKLIVKIDSGDAPAEIINHETLDDLFKKFPKSEKVHYYKAVRDESPEQTPKIAKIGALNIYAAVGAGNRRMAYVNSNGMLISDSKEMKSNPIFPRGRSLWPNYAVVAVPASESGDKWIRSMENPSHESISVEQIADPKERRQAAAAFEHAKNEIRALIDSKAETHKLGDISNLRELARMFPELDPNEPGIESLHTRKINPRRGQNNVPDTSGVILEDEDDSEIAVEGEGNAGNETNRNRNTSNDNNENDDEDKDEIDDNNDDRSAAKIGGDGRRKPKPSRSTASGVRVMKLSANEVALAFTPQGEPPFNFRLALRPAGEEYRSEEEIKIITAQVANDAAAKASVQDGALIFTADSNERALIKITAQDSIEDLAFRVSISK